MESRDTEVSRIQSDWSERRQRQEFVSFHFAMRWFLLTLKVFLMFPVDKLLTWNPNALSHRKITPAYCGTIFLLFCSGFETLAALKKLFRVRIAYTPAFVFFVTSFTSQILFFYTAKAWPEYVKYWRQQEKPFLTHPYRPPRVHLTVLLTLVGTSMLFISIVEHIFYVMSEYHFSYEQLAYCNATERISVLLNMAYNQKEHVFEISGYLPLLALIFEWVNVMRTLCWNSTDVFIVVLSIALVARFSQFNRRIRETKGKIVIGSEWRELRQHYGNLVDLTKATEELLENYVLLSCSNNLYFICFLLFDVRRKRDILAVQLRYWITLIYIIFRTLMVLYFGSWVSEISKEPVRVLKLVPWNQYSIEIRRFIDQIQAERVSLSGRLFFLTRSFMLGMMGTVVTYEVVLMDHFKPQPEGPPTCDFLW